MSQPRWMINSGDLIHRVKIQKPIEERNAEGETVITGWQTVATVAAFVKPLAGRELWQALQVQSDVTHQVDLRYFPGLIPKWRFLFPGCDGDEERPLNIERAMNIEERNVKHECLCKEVV